MDKTFRNNCLNWRMGSKLQKNICGKIFMQSFPNVEIDPLLLMAHIDLVDRGVKACIGMSLISKSVTGNCPGEGEEAFFGMVSARL